MLMVRDPKRFNGVIHIDNTFGDILSDILGGVNGTLEVLSSASLLHTRRACVRREFTSRSTAAPRMSLGKGWPIGRPNSQCCDAVAILVGCITGSKCNCAGSCTSGG
ncbi:uncharacterized protein A1O9_00880, partial [Exophiala aquamarina CBS 119918]